MAAHRPDTDEAIAMFIDDQNALWKLAHQAKTTLSIEFPVKAGGTRTAVFETGGLDGKQRCPVGIERGGGRRTVRMPTLGLRPGRHFDVGTCMISP